MRVFWRLLGFLSPYKPGVGASFVLAAMATGMGVALPALIGMTVNRIEDGQGDLLPYRRRIVGAGVLRWVFSVPAPRWWPGACRWRSSSTCATGCTATSRRWSSASSTGSRPAS